MTWRTSGIDRAGPEFSAPLDCDGVLLAVGDTVEATDPLWWDGPNAIPRDSRGVVLETRPRLDLESGLQTDPIPNGVRVALPSGRLLVSAGFRWRKVVVN